MFTCILSLVLAGLTKLIDFLSRPVNIRTEMLTYLLSHGELDFTPWSGIIILS